MKRWMTVFITFALNLSAIFWLHTARADVTRSNVVASAANGGVAAASTAGTYPVANVNDGVLVPANIEYWQASVVRRFRATTKTPLGFERFFCRFAKDWLTGTNTEKDRQT